MIYFTADTHFGHTNIINYENRPFADVLTMNRALVKNWNDTVNSNDEVYILGDFAFMPATSVNELLRMLNGRKFLIKGNHDSFIYDKLFDKAQFEWIRDYHVLKHQGQKFVLFHYPIDVWDCKHHGAIHLYGHIHSDQENHHPMVSKLVNAFNVGVDVCGYKPISINEIVSRSVYVSCR